MSTHTLSFVHTYRDKMSNECQAKFMNLPNKLTIIRIILVPFFVALFLIESIPYNALLATIVFALASLTDMLDGYIARKYNLITDFGKFLDPIADKILVNAAAVLLVFTNYNFLPHSTITSSTNNSTNWVSILVCVIAIIYISREMIVSGFRLVASNKGIVMAADKLGKIKTITQMIGLILLLPMSSFQQNPNTPLVIVAYIGLSILIVSAIVSILSCTNYILQNKQVLQSSTPS